VVFLEEHAETVIERRLDDLLGGGARAGEADEEEDDEESREAAGSLHWASIHGGSESSFHQALAEEIGSALKTRGYGGGRGPMKVGGDATRRDTTDTARYGRAP
jgi:hypothetical protein